MFEFIAQAMGGNAMEDFLASVNVLTDRMTEIRDELRVGNVILAMHTAASPVVGTSPDDVVKATLAILRSARTLAMSERITETARTPDEPPLDAGYKHPFTEAQRTSPLRDDGHLSDATLEDER